MNKINLNTPFRYTGKGDLNERKTIGSSRSIKSIDEYITLYSEIEALTDGEIVQHADYGVSYKLYYDTVSSEWKARVYDGVIQVKAVNIGDVAENPVPIGDRTIDGVSIVEGDWILCPSWYGPLRGIYKHDGANGWVRHPLFDESTESLSGITIQVTHGDYYKDSQWKYTTVGMITPDNELSTTINDFSSDPTTFFTYTHLVFEMIGGNYKPSEYYPEVSELFDFDILIDTSSGDVECSKLFQRYIPFKEYTWVKTHDNNLAIVNFNQSINPEDTIILKDKNDWIKSKLLVNPPVDKSSFYFLTNRENKVVTVTAIADGKIYDVPTGYMIYSLTGRLTTPQTTPTPDQDSLFLFLGSTIGDYDLTDTGLSGYYNDGTVQQDIVLENKRQVSEIWISEFTDSGALQGWDDAEIEFKIHLIKL